MKKLALILALGLSASLAHAAAIPLNAKESKIAWVGTKVTGKHNGSVAVKSGSLEEKDGKIVGGEVVVDMDSIKVEDITDAGMNKKLTDHLKSDDFFGVSAEANKTAKLVIKKLSLKAGDNYDAEGDLTIKGQTHPISFPVTISKADGKYTAHADLKVDRTKYNVRYNSGKYFPNVGDKMIHDEFSLSVDLVANAPNASKPTAAKKK